MDNTASTAQEYDIIIIGAGTAGSLLAYRLSAQPHLSILVLEAGENRNDDSNIYTPGLSNKLLDNDDYDWQFKTEPERGLCGRRVKHPRGKVVGGSSAINSFALLYPSRAGIDAWERLGNDGWNWQTLRPYFERFQTIGKPPDEIREKLLLTHSEEAVHRTKGQLHTSFPARVQPLQKAWVETWRALSLENLTDAFDGDAIGGHTSVCHISSETKQRSHAGEAFLANSLDRENLSVITGAHVERIVFSKDGVTAVASGVRYIKNDESNYVCARKKVVLAAGSLSSSAILELSGIGDQQRLSPLGIPLTYHNIAVGENLQDHIRAGLNFEATDDVPKRNALPELEAREKYETNREGPWAEAACWMFSYMPLLPFIDAGEQHEWERTLKESFSVNSTQTPLEKEHEDFVRAMLLSPHEAAATAFLSRKPAAPIEATNEEPMATNWIALCAMLSHPLSRGSVHIASRSPHEPPKIKCNYYSNHLDLEVHARIMKGLERLAETEPFSRYLKRGGRRSPSLKPDSSLDDIKAALKMYACSNYHPVGTCSMLPEEIGGVVDSRLRVYGTENLHVVDASIMPIIPRANIITTVFSVAERAADLLMEDITLAADGGRCAQPGAKRESV
jgi:choline dehydrogenase-like flavoprotein